MKKCVAKKDFISPVYGNVDEGRVLELEDSTAAKWEEAGLVRIAMQTKEGLPDLGKVSVAASLSSASQAAQASPKQTVKSSVAGAKKISKKKSGAS